MPRRRLRVPLFVAALFAALLALAGCSRGDSAADDEASTETTTTATTSSTTTTTRPPAAVGSLVPAGTIFGEISPKSVVASGKGLFFAQNMMYQHTITVYDRDRELLATISDEVDLAELGHPEHTTPVRGAPVEAAFSPDGRYAYVSNYSMYGPGFGPEGSDKCSPSSGVDDSFVYRVDTETLEIDQAIEVGPVPKYVAVTQDGDYLLVSNWCGYDLSVVDTELGEEVRRIDMGAYPRGIAVAPDGRTAYVAVMGSTLIRTVDLGDFTVGAIEGVGRGPRHLVIDPEGRYLYVTLNSEGTVGKIDLETGAVVSKVRTGSAPRSMDISGDGTALYVVNYNSNTVSKVRTEDMAVLQTVPVGHHPIGITQDPETRQVWVANYGGSIMVFDDA